MTPEIHLKWRFFFLLLFGGGSAYCAKWIYLKLLHKLCQTSISSLAIRIRRKSSLLRCLTGVAGGNASWTMQVSQASGSVIAVYCRLSALHGERKPELPLQFIIYINGLRPVVTDVAITLRVKAAGQFPAWDAYVQAFISAGWPVKNVALLDASACSQQASILRLAPAANICQVPASSRQPTNRTASLVRNVWKWE